MVNILSVSEVLIDEKTDRILILKPVSVQVRITFNDKIIYEYRDLFKSCNIALQIHGDNTNYLISQKYYRYHMVMSIRDRKHPLKQAIVCCDYL